MEEALTDREIKVNYLETADETVYLGYRTHLTDATRLFSELTAAVTTVLERKPGTAIDGAMFHTQHPVIATWHVDADWADGYHDGSLPEAALMTLVLEDLDAVSFQ